MPRIEPRDLLAVCRTLLAAPGGSPPQAFLRRATSTAYYAVFHALADCCARSFIEPLTASDKELALQSRVYRALDHGPARAACLDGDAVRLLAPPIQRFAETFVELQTRRHAADYDPLAAFTLGGCLQSYTDACRAVEILDEADDVDRRDLVSLVLFRRRR